MSCLQPPAGILRSAGRKFLGGNFLKKNKRFIFLIFIFLAVFSVYLLSRVKTPADSRWSIYTALSIIKEGNTNLDEYSELIKGVHYYGVQSVKGHLYNRFPVGPSLLALPFVFAADRTLSFFPSRGLEDFIRIKIPSFLEMVIASFYSALAAVFIYLLAELFLENKFYLCLLTFIFAFGTSAWSTASRALWQHGPSMLMLAISLYLILLAEKKPKLIKFVSWPLFFSLVIRPTNSISILLLSLYIFIKYRQYFWSYLTLGALIMVPFLIFNWSIYGSFISPYYLPQRLLSNPNFFEALAGNLISPARGLFIFSPIFLFSIFSIFLKIKKKDFNLLDSFLLATIFLHWLVISSFKPWWAGHSFGPRFFSDMTPYLIYFLIPAVALFSELKRPVKTIYSGVFFILLLLSVFINAQGACNWRSYWWNDLPVDVDLHPERIRDFTDPQFLR